MTPAGLARRIGEVDVDVDVDPDRAGHMLVQVGEVAGAAVEIPPHVRHDDAVEPLRDPLRRDDGLHLDPGAHRGSFQRIRSAVIRRRTRSPAPSSTTGGGGPPVHLPNVVCTRSSAGAPVSRDTTRPRTST